MVEVATSAVYDLLGQRSSEVDTPIVDYIIQLLSDVEFIFDKDDYDLLVHLLTDSGCVMNESEVKSVCEKLSVKLGKQGREDEMKKDYGCVRRLVAPVRMCDDYEDEFSVSISGNELIGDDLVGRNGPNETKFPGQMAMPAVDGILKNCQILHVEQEIEGHDISALQCILNSEVEGTELLQQVTFLDLLVDCNGTTNIIVKIDGGYLVAVESRKTEKIHIDNEPVRILKSDNDVKHMVAGNGVIITFSGGANRCNSILNHLKEVVKVNDDVIAIETHIAKYVRKNVLAVGSKGATMFVVGGSLEGQREAYRAGDDRPRRITGNYATIGSGGHAAEKELSRLGHTKEGALFDLERSIVDIYKAMLQSVVKDRSSGGKISVLMVTADYCGELPNPIAKHGIDIARYFKMPFCNKTAVCFYQ